MRSIEQMLAEGDFDAIRQLVDKEEAEAKRKAEEKALQEKYLQEKEKEIAEAREAVAEAMLDYLLALGLEFNESAEDDLIEEMSAVLKSNEKSLRGMYSFLFGAKPSVKVVKSKPTAIKLNDDEVFRKFLDSLVREGV